MICSMFSATAATSRPETWSPCCDSGKKSSTAWLAGTGSRSCTWYGSASRSRSGRIAWVVYSRTRMRRLATPSTTSLLLNRAPVHSCRSATATAPGSSTSESRAASGGSGTSPYAMSCGLRPSETSAARTLSSVTSSPTIVFAMRDAFPLSP